MSDGRCYPPVAKRTAWEIGMKYEREVSSAASRIKAAHQREVEEMKRKVAELRECLKEAIREKCPFTRMSCKHGEPCEYVCGTDKWRKALEGAKDESK